MDVIRNWLNGPRDYGAGVDLYNQYGDDPDMKLLFREFRTSFKEKKLVELLKGLMATDGASKKKTEAKEKQLVQETFGWPEKMTTGMKALKDRWKPMYDEFRNLTSRLYDVAKQGQKDKNKELEAGQMAHRILNLRDQIQDIYYERDYFLKNKVFPGKKQEFVPVVDDLKIAERRLTVRRYLTRLKNELAKTDKPELRMKQEKQWAKYVAEMKYINEKLKRPENEGIPARNQ